MQGATAAGGTAAPLQWTNPAAVSTVTGANGLTVTWTGGDPASDTAARIGKIKISVGVFPVTVKLDPAVHAGKESSNHDGF